MRKTLTAAVAALAIGLAGCTTSKDNENTEKYPREAKENFVNSCTDTSQRARTGDREAARTACQCTIDKLEQRLPYDTKTGDKSFKDADMALKDGKALPSSVKDVLDRATADCRQGR